MTCPNCGQSYPPSTIFCSRCGTKLTTANTSNRLRPPSIDEPTYNRANTPVNTAYFTQSQPDAHTAYYNSANVSAKQRGLSKKQYLKFEAPQNIKTLSKHTFTLFGVSALLIILCLVSALTVPFFDIPVFSVVFSEYAEEIEYEYKSSVENFDETYEYALKELYEQEELDEISGDEFDAMRDILDTYRKAMKNPSLGNIHSLINQINSQRDDLPIYYNWSNFNWVVRLANLGIIALYVVTFMIIGFSFLSAYLKSTVSATFAVIFTLLFELMFANLFLALAAVAVNIVLIVFCAKINSAYKS